MMHRLGRTGFPWRVTAPALVAVSAAISLGFLAGPAGAGIKLNRTRQPSSSSGAGGPTYVLPTTSTTTLSVMPHPAVTNQTVTLTAVITSSSSLIPPSGTVTFFRDANPLNGCTDEPVTTDSQSTTVACQASFAASTSPVHLRAVFAPTNGSGMAGSSDTAVLTVNRGPTSVSLNMSSSAVAVGTKVTYRATLHAMAGPVLPSGVVEFRDPEKAWRSCARQPLRGGTATCTLSYRTTGRHRITAVYKGDLNFLASTASASRSVRVFALGTINSTMQWTFAYRPTYTQILAFSVNSAPDGATIVVKCHGAGCLFGKRSTPVTPCKPTPTHKCSQGSATINLEASFHRRRLGVGTAVNVEVLRPAWIGKYYLFTMLAGRAPKIQISCLAPGQTVPGRGC
jgi:hypothetical protein